MTVAFEDLPSPLVVCIPADAPNPWPDDMYGACALCDRAVRFQPAIPMSSSLVCLLCFIVRADPDELRDTITAASLEALGRRWPCGRES